MCTDIMFKGLRTDNEEYIYGHYSVVDGRTLISDKTDHHFVVHPESVGQYTGRLDFNQIKIYATDEVLAWRGAYRYSGRIKYEEKECAFVIKNESGYLLMNYFPKIGVLKTELT